MKCQLEYRTNVVNIIGLKNSLSKQISKSGLPPFEFHCIHRNKFKIFGKKIIIPDNTLPITAIKTAAAEISLTILITG